MIASRKLRLPNCKAGLVSVALLLAGASAPAQAAMLVWTLNDVKFADGGVATGFFEYDPVANSFGNFAIDVSGGDTSVFPAFTYSPATTPGGFQLFNSQFNFFNFSLAGVFFPEFVPPRQIRFAVTSAPTSAGGTLFIDPNNFFGAECYNCDPFRLVTGGTLTSGPGGGGGGNPGVIPEPATWAMMIAGFGLVGGMLRRRRVQPA